MADQAIAVADIGLGTDAAAVLVTPAPIAEAGVGVESAFIQAALKLVEGTQTAWSAVGPGSVYDPSVDTGLGIDVTMVLGMPAVAEAGVGAESASVLATLAALAETGMGVEGASVLLSLLLTEVGIGVDLTTPQIQLALSETGTGQEQLSMQAALGIADSGVGLDAVLDVLNLHVYIRTDGIVDPLGVILLQGGREDALPGPRENTEAIPGRSGEYDFGSDAGPRGLELRVASKDGLTVAQKTALKRYVAGWLRPALGAFNIAWEDDPDRYLQVRISGAIQPEEYRDWLQFTVPLKATNPMYLGSTLHMQTGSGTVVVSEGNVDSPATVTITGPVTNPSVTVGASSFTWTGSLGGLDTLVVDGERMTVAKNGVNALGGFSGTFPSVQPGANTITAAAAGTTKVAWRDHWI